MVKTEGANGSGPERASGLSVSPGTRSACLGRCDEGDFAREPSPALASASAVAPATTVAERRRIARFIITPLASRAVRPLAIQVPPNTAGMRDVIKK